MQRRYEEYKMCKGNPHVTYISYNLGLFLFLVFAGALLMPLGCESDRTESRMADKSKNRVGETEAELPALYWQIDYDENNRCSSFIDPAGRHTQLHYDLADNGRVRQQVTEYPDGSEVTYNFDDFERRVGMVDEFGRATYEYDNLGRLTTVHRENRPSLQYSYDTMNRLVRLSIGDTFHVHYVYDFLGRLSQMRTPAGDITYEYQTGQGLVIRTLPNGIRTSWQTYPEGNLKEITHLSSDNVILLQYSYSYRTDGLISKIEEYTSREGHDTFTYEYDQVQRLISFSTSRGQNISYGYDKVGNRTEIRREYQLPLVSTYDRQGRMVQHNAHECDYERAGNLLSYENSDGRKTFEYNSHGLLKSVGDGDIQYEYDGDDFLASRHVNDGSTIFVSDPTSEIWRPLVATESTGDQSYYIWENDFPLGIISGEEYRFFLHDHLGSVRSITDERGKITSLHTYSPYGVPERPHPNAALHPGFAGLFYDTSASIYLTRARAYDAGIGRFLQVDPQHRPSLGSQQGLSSYSYAGSDPVNFFDRDGAARKWIWGPENWAWQILYKPLQLLDHNYAKQFYARKSESVIQSAKGRGIGAGLEATLWDVVGGYIPGMAANRGQRHAQIGWSLVGTGSSFGAVGTGLSFGRTFASSLINSSEGKLSEAALDVIGLEGTWMGMQAKRFRGSTFLRSPKAPILRGKQYEFSFVSDEINQYLFSFMSDEIMETAELYETGKEIIEGLGYLRLSGEFTDIVTEGGGAGRGSGGQNYDGYPGDDGGSIGGPGRPGDNGGGGGCGGGPPKPSNCIVPSTSILDPSNVGGIYLRGVGRALEGLGLLIGLAVDESNGRLVLISQEQGEIELPPLRLDDVVTVFRSVYQYGDAPYVSIDPNPRDPHGELMLVRHGPGTVNTYTGWVLFEADRVMKAYSLGKDNINNQPVTSNIRSYQNLLDLGFSNFGKNQGDPIWERFWIVPAEVNRRQTRSKSLTLFDVSLKVQTQRMELQGNRLVPAENQQPSQAAETFADWFTENYDDIASEAFTQPPADSEIDSSVSVFSELRRIALIAAMAENLRDQGIPLPYWMRDFQIRQCPVPPTTPAVIVSESRGPRQLQIYGGVNLSPSDEDVHTNTADRLAEELERQAFQAINGVPLFSTVSFTVDNKEYQAVALPGNETKELSACILKEVDVIVPVQGNRSVALIRKLNSFFQPNDVLGNAWTLDLPRLEAQNIPVHRRGDTTVYELAYQLITPLSSYTEYFTTYDDVPALNSKLLVPDRPGPAWGIAEAYDSRIDLPTHVMLLRNGSRWHFDESGNLAAIDDEGLMVIYRRGGMSHIKNIEGWYGDQMLADIQLSYDRLGRLEAARGSNDHTVEYRYDDDGNLRMALHNANKIEYEYDDGLVTGIKFNDNPVREFRYGNSGRLILERRADRKEISYQVISGEYGNRVEANQTSYPNSRESIQYDNSLRPIRQVFENGAEIQWQYSETASTADITFPGGERYKLRLSADSKNITVQSPEGSSVHAYYDDNGQLTELKQDQHPVLNQIWRADGKLERAIYESFAYHLEYSPDGTISRVFITPPDQHGSFKNWASITYDKLGRPQAFRDYTGFEEIISYDENGNISEVVTNQTSVSFSYTEQGYIEGVQTSWGYAQKNHYDDRTKSPSKIEITQGDEKSFVVLEDGKLKRIQQFDGGEYRFQYGMPIDKSGLMMLPEIEDSPNVLTQITTPDNLVINWDYNSVGQVVSINMGGMYTIGYSWDASGCMTGCGY